MPRRVWTATAIQVLGRLAGALCTAATLVLLARVLSPEEFGRYTFYLALFALLDALTDCGSGSLIVQRTAADPWALPGSLAFFRRLRLGSGSLAIALLAAVALWQREPGLAWILAAGLYQWTHALELSAVVFRNEIAFGRLTLVRTAAALARLALVGGLALGGVRDPAVLLFATALGSSLANVLLHWSARARLPRTAMPVRAPAGLFAAALPLGLAGLCQQAYFYADNVWVRELCGERALGHYNAGVRLMSFAIMVAQYASLAALPLLARARAEGGIGRAASRIAQPIFLAACAAAGLLHPQAESLLALAFGEEYRAGAAALRWLLLAAVAVHAGAAWLTGVVALGATRAVLAIAAGGLALNCALNALWIPRHGIAGAGMATCATEVYVALASALALGLRGQHALRERAWVWPIGPALFLACTWLSAHAAARFG
jgi:O-antigen/teichoic acid export membrane protein